MPVVDEVSEPEAETVAMADPDTSDWFPGLLMVTVLVMVQVNEVVAVYAAESVALTVTEEEPAVVGVPEMVPVVPLIDSPVGRPVAE